MEALDMTSLPAEILDAASVVAEDSGLLAAADAALDASGDPGLAAAIIGQIADALIDFELLEIGPLGDWLEAHDGDAATWMADVVIRLAMDDERRAKRQDRRAMIREQMQVRREERKARRAERKH